MEPGHPWVIRRGNCWFYSRTKSCQGHGGSKDRRKAFPLALHQGPPLLYTAGGASGPKAQRETQRPPIGKYEGQARKEALKCPQLRQSGLRGRAGQQHLCPMGLECGGRGDQDTPCGHGSCKSTGASRPGFRLSSLGPGLCLSHGPAMPLWSCWPRLGKDSACHSSPRPARDHKEGTGPSQSQGGAGVGWREPECDGGENGSGKEPTSSNFPELRAAATLSRGRGCPPFGTWRECGSAQSLHSHCLDTTWHGERGVV